MVNWKLLGISVFAFLGAYGTDYVALNTRKGYDYQEYGLRKGDNAIVQYVLPITGPGRDLFQEATGIRLGWDEPYLQNNDYKFFQVEHKATGATQIASAITGAWAFRRRKESKESKK